jgi:asparagine synthase (glutamine-hydrolysing)
MCGIGGILPSPGRGPASRAALERMLSVLDHRGPDGYGIFRDAGVALGHTRLSIIDLTGGAQPLCNEDGTVWLTFNGEIFNYVELRETLLALGHVFRTQSDSEVIVHAYEAWGEQAWLRFNGQFAFALWDARQQRLHLVRDPLGILPIHYAETAAGLIFASEAKALFASGYVRPELDPAALVQVFTRWSARSPRSAFRGVATVPPGTALVVEPGRAPVARRYFTLDLTPDPALADLGVEGAAELLGAALARSVQVRLRADVPVGAYLSGGLDSSVIGERVREVSREHLQTFAVRFVDPRFDETEHQRRMAALLGTEHHEVLCGAEALSGALPEVVWHVETPLLRTAPVPLYLLSGLVQGASRRVVLTGEGADELFAGYNIFKEDRIRRFWARQPGSKARPALLARLYPYVVRGRGEAMWQAFFRRGLEAVDDPLYSHRIRWSNTAATLRFLAPELIGAVDPAALEAELVAGLPAGFTGWTPLARAQWLEVDSFLSTYLLASQGDRVAMGHSVEVRYPFLDPEVVQLAGRLPDRVKLQGLKDKRALRRLAARTLPPEIFARPKQPYRAPMTAPFFGPERPAYVEALLEDSALEASGVVALDAARPLIAKARAHAGHLGSEREEMALVGLITLQLLVQAYGPELEGRLAAARARFQRARRWVLEDRVGEAP